MSKKIRILITVCNIVMCTWYINAAQGQEYEDDPDQTVLRSRKCKKFCSVRSRDLIACLLNVLGNAGIGGNLTVDGNETIGGNLTVNGNELVKGDLTVLGNIIANIIPTVIGNLEIIGTPQRACIIFRDALLNEKARICSSAIAGDKGVFVSVDGGLTENLRINNEGGSVIVPPTSGPGLSVTGNALAPAVIATGNGTLVAPALSLINNPPASPTDFILTIDPSGAVTESTIPIGNGFIINGCQPGPISIGTSDLTTLTLVTQCLSRLSIDADGAISIAMPTAGEALTVNGNIVLPVANGAGTQGLLKLGGTSTVTNVVIYEVGTRNLFAGNGAVNAAVTGTDNISIGTSANSTLTAANHVIGIGTSASAAATDSIAIGDQANAAAARTIVIGSRDSLSTGAAPVANALNAIAIGTARGTQAGAVASGLSAIAFGSGDILFPGASATGARSLAIGINSQASAAQSIAIGSASGIAGGVGPNASNTNSIAIGSGNNNTTAAVASGLASIALGSADSSGIFAGAQATGDRSIAIGINAGASAAGSITIGSASGTAGGSAPVANNITAIAIGSGHANRAGAIASGISAVAIGGADGTAAGVSNFPGAVASGNRSIAIGINTTASADGTIAIGSVSAVGSLPARATDTTAIAIGAAAGGVAGPIASAPGAIALGSASGGVVGAVASGARSVAIGNGANTAQADAILLGNAGVTAVRVGIGINAPTSKLHVVGVNGTPVITLDQVNNAITNAPVLLNLSSSAVAGTPLHINGANQVFAFISSERFKDNIRSIKAESEIIYELEPVLYDAKEGYGRGADIPGFIAEQVWQVAPNLVILNSDNEPINVAYNSLHALAINEIQKQQERINEQATIIDQQAATIAVLRATLQELQARMQALE